MSLVLKLQELFQSQNTGARVITVNDNTYVVYDCSLWDTKMESLLLRHFNNVHIDIKSSNKSLSGFEIVLHMDSLSQHLWWLVCTIPLFIILAMLLHTCWVQYY
jgi:hypothetical protein